MSGRQHRETEIARRIRARGLAAGRTTAQIADEIHEACTAQFSTTRIKAHRLAYGIALADVIEQVRALFERDNKPMPGIGETLLSAYESGLKRPGPEYLHYLCTVYRVEPIALGYDAPCICGHSHRAPSPGIEIKERCGQQERDLTIKPADPEPDPDAEEDENILRRTLLNLLNTDGKGVKLDGPVLGACEGIRRRMDETLVSATVSAAMLDQWEEATVSFGRQYTTTAPLRLLCDVLLELSAVRTAMSRRQPIDLQERLCRMAAQLAGLSGMILINLGDHRLARSFFRTGRTAADETGDRALRAWICARESLVPLYFGDAREALNLAKKSRDMAGSMPCPAQAMAPVVEARALAALAAGDGNKKEIVDQAKRALARARNAFAHMRAEDREDVAFGYTEKQLYFYQGDVLTKLGQTIEAEVVLDQALTKYEDHILDQTLIRLDQAQCKLIDGELAEAVAIGTRALSLVGDEYFTDLIVRPALALGEALKAAGAPGVDEYFAQLRRPKQHLMQGGDK
ncbi:XRE family transcriptional regulator [Nonomuraea sp. NPDC049309]|uniref:XRE family transcriptional regulator n=1 Tax=Nonomuraea sp. NPDC049309 TaxID=3364350 RepID=UPI0037231CCD